MNLDDFLAQEANKRADTSERYRSGFVALVGRPNVGKSTLLNALLGQKISITSPKPQTTRHRIHGVKSENEYQMVLVDTPGMHMGESKALNRYMNRAADSALLDVDVVVFIVDSMKWTKEDANVARKLEKIDIPVILVVNKIDTIKRREDMLPHLAQLSEKVKFDALVPLSAKSRNGIDRLEEEVLKHFENTTPIFPEDYVTDKSERFVAAEFIREKLMRQLDQELPYGLTVEIEQFEQDPTDPEKLLIGGVILVERAGQKNIVIGKQGRVLKEVGTQARKDMERMFEQRVYLRLWVKVKDNWSDDDRALASLGYTD